MSRPMTTSGRQQQPPPQPQSSNRLPAAASAVPLPHHVSFPSSASSASAPPRASAPTPRHQHRPPASDIGSVHRPYPSRPQPAAAAPPPFPPTASSSSSNSLPATNGHHAPPHHRVHDRVPDSVSPRAIAEYQHHPDASPRLRAGRTTPQRDGFRHNGGEEMADWSLEDGAGDEEEEDKYQPDNKRRSRGAGGGSLLSLTGLLQLLSWRHYRSLSVTGQLLASLLSILLLLVLFSSSRQLWLRPLPSLPSLLHPRPSRLSLATQLVSHLATDNNDVLLHPASLHSRPASHIADAPSLHDDHLDLSPHSPSPSSPASSSSLPVYSVSNLTLFTTFSPEADSSHSEWQHAMYSWTLRVPHRNILVFTSSASHCPLLHSISVDIRCRVSSCWDLVHDAPYLRCVLTEARDRADTPLLLFIEDHVVLFADLMPALLKLAASMPAWVASGRSREMRLTVEKGLDLAVWQQDLEHAYLYDSSGIATVEDRENKKIGEEEHDGVHDSETAAADSGGGLHYLAYPRELLPLDSIDPAVLMGGGSYIGHEWEKLLISALLLHPSRPPLVDISASVTTVELMHAEHGNVTRRLNDINSELTGNFSGRPVTTLGRLENAHYVMLGQCPTCLLKENREADLPLILLRQSGASRSIIVIAVNSEYLSLAANWICRAHSLGITNFILLAEDRIAYRILRKMDVPVVLRKDAPYRKQAASIGSKEFQETLYLRAIFLQQVMTLGFDLVLSHLDTVWYQNPLPLFAAADCDMMVQFEAGQGRAGGGILSLRHNRLGLQFVSDYLECEYENYAFISLHGRGRFTYSDDPDIDCVELISQRMERRSRLRRCPLDPQLFVSERIFFDAQLPQHRAVWPLFVHLNAGGGVRNKTRVFMDWDLWAVDEGAMTQIPLIGGGGAAAGTAGAGGGRRDSGHQHMQLQCKREDERVAMPDYERQHHMRFIINLLASTEQFALEETLAHLSNAQYDAATPVDLHLTIQQAEQESSSTGRMLVETTRVANDFVWPWGEKRIIYLDSYVGPSARWIDSWSVDVGRGGVDGGAEAGEDPDENEEDEEEVFQLALYPGMIVSSQWFAWTRQALQAYYFHPFQYDAQLMGIHLMHQFTILGETPTARFGSRIPSSVLNGSMLYQYQLVPLFGTVFFPTHFLSFLHWYHGQSSSVLSTACVPTLISNRWYLSEPVSQWSQWLHRFTFESGWYALYANWHSSGSNQTAEGRKPRALLIDVTPLASHLTVSLVKRLSTREKELPAAADIRLYDLHFREFTQERRLLAVRKTMFPPVGVVREKEETHRGEMRQREEERRKRELARQGSAAEPHAPLALSAAEAGGGHSEEGLWARLERYRSQGKVVDVGDMALLHSSDGQHDQQQQQQDEEDEDERGVTATELILELMVAAMSTDASTQSSTTHSAAQVERIRRKVQRTLAGAGHLHRGGRNPFNHSRCFTMDQLADLEAKVSTDSAPPAAADSLVLDGRYHNDLLSLYSSIAATATTYIVYQPSRPPIPFDRHLRGLHFAFLAAIVSQRVLLIDLPEFHRHYRSPFANISWEYARHSQQLQGLTSAVMDTAEINARLRTEALNDIYPQPVVVHGEGISHDRLLFKNVKYQSLLPALFSSYSRMRRTGTVSKLLLSQPSSSLREEAAATLSRVLSGRTYKYSVCVHLVYASSISSAHWDCVVSQLIHQGWSRDDTAIIVSSSSHSQAVYTEAVSRLSKYGQVLADTAAFTHPLAAREGSCNTTFNASTAELHDPYILHHFILGDCDVSITSGTTYGIFGAARTGFSKRAYVYRAAPPPLKGKDGKITTTDEPDYCGPMHRIDLPKENDINF